MEKKKAFLVAYGGGHINILLPIANKMSKYFNVTVLALTNAKSKALDAGVNTKTYFNYANQDELELGKQYQHLHTDNGAFNVHDTIAYYGVNMCCLIKEVGETKALDLFNDNGRKVFLPVEKLKEIFQIEKPDIVLTTNAPRSEFAALLAAKSMNIPCISIEDLFGLDPIEFGDFRKINRFLVPDYIFVMSENVKKCMIERGVDTKKLIVTGQPAFDKYSLMDSSLDLIEKEVLYASQPTSNTHKILESLIELKKKNVVERITVKLHPSQQYKEYTYVIDYGIELIDGQTKIDMFIPRHQVVITEYSTVGLEAIYLKRALITINLTEDSSLVPYGRLNLSYNINNLNQLKNAILDALKNGPTIEAENWIKNVNASVNISNFIKEILKMK